MSGSKKCLASLGVVLALTGLTPTPFGVPVFAATATASSAVGARLDKIEEVIYGAPKKGQTLDSRLRALEVKLFGVPRKGTVDTRLANINKALSYGSGAATGDLLPPLAPTLDTSSTAASNSSTDGSSTASSYSGSGPGYSSSNNSSDNTPDSTTALADAMQLYQAGKVPQAEAAFRKILASDPNNGDAYYNLGVIAEGKGDLNGALSNYRSALNINPQDADLQSTVAAVQNKIDANKALADSANQQKQDAARKAQLKNSVAAAASDFKQGQYDSAISKLTDVSAQVPDDADVQFALAQAYRAKGDLGNARSHMLRASSLNPANAGYASGLTAVDQAIAAKNKYSDSFASANNSGGYLSGPFSSSAPAQPQGQITPFANSQAAGYGSGLSGIASRTTSSVNNRLKRAVSYGIAGAVGGALTGALFRPSYGGSRMSGVKSAALRGAILGTVFGFATGR
jgi:tetratricopeptide (TPR) repeat protein